MASFNCDICGAINFISQANLTNHQKGAHCRAPGRKRFRPSTSEVHQVFEDTLQFQGEFKEDFNFAETSNATCSPEDVQPPYDLTFALVHWIRHCKNGMGLSERVITNLFCNVIFHKSFKLEDVKVRSAADCNRYEDGIYVKEDGWLEYGVIEKVGDPYPIHLYYKDPVVALCALFSTPTNGEGFDLGPKSSSSSSSTTIKRSYSTPSSGDWWQFKQGYIGCLGGVIAPLILYTDQTSLSNNGRVSGYPLVLSLGNIVCELRPQEEGHMLLAMMPVIPASDLPSHKRRLEIFHECLN
jgi:hypothetical protein